MLLCPKAQNPIGPITLCQIRYKKWHSCMLCKQYSCKLDSVQMQEGVSCMLCHACCVINSEQQNRDGTIRTRQSFVFIQETVLLVTSVCDCMSHI
jgi:hypothetical protein